jgi:sarcosine oxidase, subunit gamma
MPAKLFDGRSHALSPLDAPIASGGAMRIADLSLWPRAGLKGSAATQWMIERGAVIPEINAAQPQRDGSLLARLAETEYLALAQAASAAEIPAGLPDFSLDGDNDAGLCPVPRFAGNAWFGLAGDRLAEMFAKMCGVDLRDGKFANHKVAQTIVAHTTAILVRDDAGSIRRFHVIVDWTTARYLWDALIEAMQEYSGAIVVPDLLAH